jgi:hypothetical protein
MITPDVIMSLHNDRQRELVARTERNRLIAFVRRSRRAESRR